MTVSMGTGAVVVFGHPPRPCSVPSHAVVQGGVDCTGGTAPSCTDVLSAAWDP